MDGDGELSPIWVVISGNRTCLPSLVTLLLPPSSHPSLHPSFHPFTPSSPSPSIASSLTTLHPLHPHSLTITLSDAHTPPYQTSHPKPGFSTPLAHSSNVADLLIWVVVFPQERSDRRERSSSPASTFNLLAQSTSHSGP